MEKDFLELYFELYLMHDLLNRVKAKPNFRASILQLYKSKYERAERHGFRLDYLP